MKQWISSVYCITWRVVTIRETTVIITVSIIGHYREDMVPTLDNSKIQWHDKTWASTRITGRYCTKPAADYLNGLAVHLAATSDNFMQ